MVYVDAWVKPATLRRSHHGLGAGRVRSDEAFVEVAEKHVKFFKSLSPKKNNEYFYYFAFCELLNCVVVVANYYLINTFLGGRFSTYGADVIAYSQADPINRDDIYDPMCDAFPTLVNCRTNNFCILKYLNY